MIRMGVVGMAIGAEYRQEFQQLEGARVVAVADLNEASLKKAKKAYPHLQVTTQCEEVIKSPEVDVVAIVTPVFTHYELAQKALQQGKHILVEKPFTYTNAQRRN